MFTNEHIIDIKYLYRSKSGKSVVKELTEFLFLLEEGTIKGMGGRVEKELEAVEDLDRPSPLDADDATEDSGRRDSR